MGSAGLTEQDARRMRDTATAAASDDGSDDNQAQRLAKDGAERIAPSLLTPSDEISRNRLLTANDTTP
jgi:hypothetical protein